MTTVKIWEKRYRSGGNSGAGSYGVLEEFKRNVINDLIEENNIASVLDLGCGDGNQIKLLKLKKYTGFDISKTIIKKCQNIYKNDKTKNFVHYNGLDIDNNYSSELGLSLDVLYHLMEEDMFFKYLKNLFTLSNKYIIIYSQNKNHGEIETNPNGHIKGRNFTDYVENTFKNWKLLKKIDQKYPELSSADFYIYIKNG